MKNKWLILISYGLIPTVALAVCGFILVKTADVVGLHANQGDLATWVGAIGTVGTLIGTIWLALSDKRERIRDKKQLAIITADLAYQEISKTLHTIATANYLMGVFSQLEPKTDDIENTLFILRMLSPWHKADLLALAPLPNRCAQRIALANHWIRRAIEVLETTQTSAINISNSQKMAVITDVRKSLAEAKTNFEIAISICYEMARLNP